MATVASVLNWLPGMSYMRAVKRRPIELGMRDTTGIEVWRVREAVWEGLEERVMATPSQCER